MIYKTLTDEVAANNEFVNWGRLKIQLWNYSIGHSVVEARLFNEIVESYFLRLEMVEQLRFNSVTINDALISVKTNGSEDCEKKYMVTDDRNQIEITARTIQYCRCPFKDYEFKL